MTFIKVGGYSVEVIDLKFGRLQAKVTFDFGFRRKLVLQSMAKTPWAALMELTLCCETAFEALRAVDEDSHADTVHAFADALGDYIDSIGQTDAE
jgi:hypothetical protein